MKIKAIAIDLDGTLTNSKKELTQRNKTAIRKAIDSGIKIILASGRPLLGIDDLAKKLDLYELGGYIMAYNGGQIIDCKSRQPIFEKLLPLKHYAKIHSIAKKFELDALTYDDEGVLAENDTEPYVIKEAYNNSIPIKKVANLVNAVGSEVVKFMVVGEPEKISRALNTFIKEFENEVNVFLSEPYFMELTAPGIHKAAGLKVISVHLGFSKEEICSIGDGLNDIPMLEYSGYAVAMGNAYPEVKAIANFITKSNDEDGVAEFIESLVKRCIMASEG